MANRLKIFHILYIQKTKVILFFHFVSQKEKHKEGTLDFSFIYLYKFCHILPGHFIKYKPLISE